MRALPERVQKAVEALEREPWPHTAHNFLRERYPWGGDAETLRRYNIGLEPNKLGRPAVLFPMRQLNGDWFYTRRSIFEGPKYEHEAGKQPPLYLPVPPQEEVAYLCEGHSDTLTARWLGYQAMGIMGSTGYKPHLDYLRSFRELRVVMDADRAGWAAAAALWAELCNVRLIFLYPPSLPYPYGILDALQRKVRNDPACVRREQGHGECKRPHRDGYVDYELFKLDLTDVTKRHGRLWADVLLGEEGGLFGPGYRSCGEGGRASCPRCGPRLGRQGTAQTRDPQAGALPWTREPRGLPGRTRYLGVWR